MPKDHGLVEMASLHFLALICRHLSKAREIQALAKFTASGLNNPRQSILLNQRARMRKVVLQNLIAIDILSAA